MIYEHIFRINIQKNDNAHGQPILREVVMCRWQP